MKNDRLIEDLRSVMKEKNVSPYGVARFVEATPKSISRWLNYENKPTLIYRKSIQRGIKRIERLP